MIENKTRQEQIHSKGFSISQKDIDGSLQFKETGSNNGFTSSKTLIDFTPLQSLSLIYKSKDIIERALQEGDIQALQAASRYYEGTSGIYRRLCARMSSFYRYDWLLTPLLKTLNYGKKGDTISNATWECLGFLENLEVKHLLNEIAHDVIVDGSYYGYLIRFKDGAVLQKLPMKYCRTREKQGNRAIVELNMKMFDDLYPDVAERYTVLKNMPKEFMKGYKLYFDNKLPPRFRGDRPGWYSLDVNCGFKFSITSNDYPFFAQVLPALLDLEVAQELDRKKMA